MNPSTQAKLDYLKSLPFPELAEDDSLSDWQSDLAEFDGYLAGLASRALGGESIDSNVVMHHVRELRSGLEAVSNLPEDDHDIRAECEAYMVALEELAKSLSL